MAGLSRDADFHIEADDSGTATVTLRGELDVANVGSLDAAVASVIERGVRRLVLDLYELRFADSSSIALWVRWAAEVDHLELQRPSPLLRKVITSMGLSERLKLTQ
jgi:anti-sigma B factor antagonist